MSPTVQNLRFRFNTYDLSDLIGENLSKVHNPRHYIQTLMYNIACACLIMYIYIYIYIYISGQMRGSIWKFGKALGVAVAACCLGWEVVLNPLSAFRELAVHKKASRSSLQ